MIKISDYKNATCKEQLYKSFKIVQLKEYLRNNGLKVSGKKCILVDRLFEFLEKNKINNNIKPNLINLLDLYKTVRRSNSFNIKNYNYNDLKYTLIKYNLKINGSQNVLVKRLFCLSKLLIKHHKNNDKIKLIQKTYKKYINKLIDKYLHFDLKKCVNDEDFLTYEDLEDIPRKFLFIYEDNKLYYAFDVRSLIKFFKSNKVYNPYNNKKFSEKIIKEINNFYHKLKLVNKDNISYEEDKLSEPYLLIRDKAIKVFQIINVELNNYADVNWFLDLNKIRLRKLYRHAEDIWNYRAQHLTKAIRKKHIPNDDAFKMSVAKFYQIININKMREIILNEFEKFVTEGESIEERKTGAMWMLTALVEVSIQACNAMPWLLQT